MIILILHYVTRFNFTTVIQYSLIMLSQLCKYDNKSLRFPTQNNNKQCNSTIRKVKHLKGVMHVQQLKKKTEKGTYGVKLCEYLI